MPVQFTLTKISGGMETAWTQKLLLVQKSSVKYSSTLVPFMYTYRYLRYSKSKAKHFPLLILVYFSLSRLAIKVEVVQKALSQPRQKARNTVAVKGKAGRLHERLQTPSPTHSYSPGTSAQR